MPLVIRGRRGGEAETEAETEAKDQDRDEKGGNEGKEEGKNEDEGKEEERDLVSLAASDPVAEARRLLDARRRLTHPQLELELRCSRGRGLRSGVIQPLRRGCP
mgnify:CR=1 FL=1